MEFYTLSEASTKLKQHKIATDYRKLMREAMAGKLVISILVHGYLYSPTIKIKCESVISKFLAPLLEVVRTSAEYQDEISQKFEHQLVTNIFNGREWSRLSDEKKISYLCEPHQEIQNMIERFSNPSIGGYVFVPPKQLINSKDGIYRIEAVTDGKESYFLYKDVSLNDFLIDENQLNKYIQSFSNRPQKQKRVTKLYAEIMENIHNWKELNATEILDELMKFEGKDGSCIKTVSNSSVVWLNQSRVETKTSYLALEKWIKRQTRHDGHKGQHEV